MHLVTTASFETNPTS